MSELYHYGIKGAATVYDINKYYSDVFDEAKDLTIEDLKKHGVIV